jgi:hypothetical protein
MTKTQRIEHYKQTPGHYDRVFARRQWRNSYAEGTFRYRGKLPSCPKFSIFSKTAKQLSESEKNPTGDNSADSSSINGGIIQ